MSKDAQYSSVVCVVQMNLVIHTQDCFPASNCSHVMVFAILERFNSILQVYRLTSCCFS